mmetsp:Transcript_16914/g.38787  ORF Transcript_16914/g.38787 Transcript_16914/m.38787 type:complete len:121 (+) Transcript_16914:105-467(+)
MSVLRNFIIAALCLSFFPSVADAGCVEMAECIPEVFPKKGKCFTDYGYNSLREYFICCTEDEESPGYPGANYCTSEFGTDEELNAEIKEAIKNSSAPTVGAWTVTALGAVATTAAAFYGI